MLEIKCHSALKGKSIWFKLILHNVVLHGHGDIKCWKKDRNSWHNGMPIGIGPKSVVKIAIVQLTNCD